LRPFGRVLSAAERFILGGYFSHKTLDGVRITVVPGIQNPPFYSDFPTEVLHGLDFRGMAGITFADVVVMRQDLVQIGHDWMSLVFHELVHVVQYGLLGIDAFVDRYLRGWAENGFEYRRIPLEMMAYDLQDAHLEGRFSIEEYVRVRLGKTATGDGS
jgi:hypothetical protein